MFDALMLFLLVAGFSLPSDTHDRKLVMETEMSQKLSKITKNKKGFYTLMGWFLRRFDIEVLRKSVTETRFAHFS